MQSASRNRSQEHAILLVDDNSDGCEARRTVLEQLGYRVLSASSGPIALEFVSEQPFDLIITDYKMAPMDGLELIRILRHQHFDKPIVLLTGFAEMLGLDKERTGADVILKKSANEIRDLVRCAKHLLSRPKKGPGKQKLRGQNRTASG
jgi:CheY-like chemotaxis protein